MKILHVTPTFYPAIGWGGPIYSTKAICDGIAARPDMQLRVLTTDAASPDRRDRVVSPAALPYPVHYARRVAGHSMSPGLLARLPAAIAWADVVHLTATYNFPTLPTLIIASALGRPVVWSPRGAMQATVEWPDAPRRGVKRWFEAAAQICRPHRTILHVTAPVEAQLSVERLKGIITAIIPNSVTIPPVANRQPQEGTLRLMFLSRLHPKKGLDRLFDAMDHLPANITLDIYGTGDTGYVAQLATRAAKSNGRIRLHGHVAGGAKLAAFAAADLFVLPTFSENFGIAIAEALAHGLPVLTTTAAPWQALDAQGCGRCFDPDRTDLTEEISTLAQQDLAQMGACGRAWMTRDFSQQAMVDALTNLYHSLHSATQKVAIA